MQIAGNMDYGYLLERHDSAWRYKYNRVELDLGTPQDILPTCLLYTSDAADE